MPRLMPSGKVNILLICCVKLCLNDPTMQVGNIQCS